MDKLQEITRVAATPCGRRSPATAPDHEWQTHRSSPAAPRDALPEWDDSSGNATFFFGNGKNDDEVGSGRFPSLFLNCWKSGTMKSAAILGRQRFADLMELI